MGLIKSVGKYAMIGVLIFAGARVLDHLGYTSIIKNGINRAVDIGANQINNIMDFDKDEIIRLNEFTTKTTAEAKSWMKDFNSNIDQFTGKAQYIKDHADATYDVVTPIDSMLQMVDSLRYAQIPADQIDQVEDALNQVSIALQDMYTNLNQDSFHDVLSQFKQAVANLERVKFEIKLEDLEPGPYDNHGVPNFD